MASQVQIDELKTKLQALADTKFGGDPAKVFTAYAGPDDLIDSSGLYRLLTDAGVGKSWQRPWWVSGIISALDKAPHDGKLSRDEIKAAANPTPHTFASALAMYGYMTITVAGGAVTHLHGAAEADAKRLFAKGVTRLLRFSSGILSESLEEFDSVGWTNCTTETL